MNTSKKAMEWLTCFSVVNLMLGCLLFKKFKKSNESCSSPKSASFHKFSSNQNQLKDTSNVHYFKLPYIGNLSHHIKNRLSKLCKEFYKENN